MINNSNIHVQALLSHCYHIIVHTHIKSTTQIKEGFTTKCVRMRSTHVHHVHVHVEKVTFSVHLVNCLLIYWLLMGITHKINYCRVLDKLCHTM